MSKNLVIVFARNLVFGKVKTRLALKLGDEKAFQVYQDLLKITSEAVESLEECTVHVFFTDDKEEYLFPFAEHFVQKGKDLGERMFLAFKNGFEMGYEKIVLIGSDLPDINEHLLLESIQALNVADFVFGPAEDGGYYLIGMKSLHEFPFIEKPWSDSLVYELTKKEIQNKELTISELEVLNDIDTAEDYLNSSLF